MAKKNVVNFGVNVSEFSVRKAKGILWQLQYSPEDAKRQLKYEGNASIQEISEALRSEYEESGRLLFFGQAQAYLATEGVDLGISNPVVRDTILEKCHAAIGNEKICIPKVVTLLKKEDLEDGSATPKIIGGLKEMGFGNKEANYLLDTCNLYPVALLLEKLEAKQQEKSAAVSEEKQSEQETVSEQEELVTQIPPEIKEDEELTKAAVSTTLGEMLAEPDVLQENSEIIQKILVNQADIRDFYHYLGNERSIEEVDEEIQEMEKELNRLTMLKAMAYFLEEAGIPYETLLVKKAEITTMLAAMTAFVA